MNKLWRWRAASRVYAALRGYFWLPGPVCGRFFGGHEMGQFAVFSAGSDTGQIACPDPHCQEVALTEFRRFS